MKYRADVLVRMSQPGCKHCTPSRLCRGALPAEHSNKRETGKRVFAFPTFSQTTVIERRTGRRDEETRNRSGCKALETSIRGARQKSLFLLVFTQVQKFRNIRQFTYFGYFTINIFFGENPRFRSGAPQPAARHSGTRRCALPPRRPLGGCSRHQKLPQGAFPPQRQRRSPHCSAATGPAASAPACNAAHGALRCAIALLRVRVVKQQDIDQIVNISVGRIRKGASSAAKFDLFCSDAEHLTIPSNLNTSN